MSKLLKYNGIIFDDYVVGEDGVWSQICSECYEKYAETLNENAEIELEGDGVCGIKNCWNNNWDNQETVFYIDFDDDHIDFMRGVDDSPPVMVVGFNEFGEPETVVDFVSNMKEAELKDNQIYRKQYAITNFLKCYKVDDAYYYEGEEYKIGDQIIRKEEPSEEPNDVDEEELLDPDVEKED